MKNVKDELTSNFTKTKTLIFYSNMFYEEDLSDTEEETLVTLENKEEPALKNKYGKTMTVKNIDKDNLLG